ncbi:serine protease gd-like isoform X3 [Pseudomyrmex gracilis]|nr:serine protease gd-like isoform X3 [Pseudomyrmex gracilis]
MTQRMIDRYFSGFPAGFHPIIESQLIVAYRSSIFRTLVHTMIKISILIALLLCTLAQISGQSSCSQYFSYITNPISKEVMGQIQIPPPPKNVPLHLKMSLSIAVKLPTRYVGQLELAQSKEESVRIVQQSRPLLYHIYFPLRRPLPQVTGIWFNEQQYCTGSRAVGQIVTSITLEHTLYPPTIVPLSYNPYFNSPYSVPNQKPTSRPTQPTIQRPTKSTPKSTVSLSEGIDRNVFLNPSIQQNSNECGISTTTNIINPLISKGETTLPGQWPWLVAIFVVRLGFDFQCAGSILTNKHVVTAAHCFKVDSQSNVNIPPSAMSVSLGRYRLRDFREVGSVNREIASYTLHPDYTHQKNGDSDLAILVLRTPVTFNPRIRPICMWSGPADLQSVVNKSGYVVGWGRDEFGNAYLAEPRMTRAPIVSQEACLRSDAQFVHFTSDRTLCAGSRDGSGPCNGDSGSGLVLHDAKTGRYYLRAVVSRSLFDRNGMTCDLTKYVVFVDVAKYRSWIQQQISIT